MVPWDPHARGEWETGSVFDTVDEGIHTGGDVWWFEFVDSVRGFAGWVELHWCPEGRRRLYVATIRGFGPAEAGHHRQLVVVDESEGVRTPGPTLEIKPKRMWAEHRCEEPLARWALGMEAFGVAVDDPREARSRRWGELVPVGFDLEWEAVAEPLLGGDRAMELPCLVHGELLIGPAEIHLDGRGWRGHTWDGTSPEPARRLWAGDGWERCPVAGAGEPVPVGGNEPTPWGIERRLVLDPHGVEGWELESWRGICPSPEGDGGPETA